MTQKIVLENGFVGKPVVDYYFELLKFLEIHQAEHRLEIFVGSDDRKEAEQLLEKEGILPDRPLSVVVPGGGESWGSDTRLKRWPVEYFADLLRRIGNEYRAVSEPILVLGSLKEFSLGEKLKELLNGFRVVNLCGRTSIRITAAMLQKAKVVFANDGGLVHVACAVNTPVIAFYGPADHKVYGPYPPTRKLALSIFHEKLSCRPCYHRMRYRSDCVGVECLTDLSPDDAFEAIKKCRFFEQLLVEERGNPDAATN